MLGSVSIVQRWKDNVATHLFGMQERCKTKIDILVQCILKWHLNVINIYVEWF